jgi:hypothetical protein
MTFTTNSATNKLTILTFDFKGIAHSNSETRAFDHCTVSYAGIARSTPGKTTAYGYSKYMDPDGDFVIMESFAEDDVITMTFLQGTGKWKGIEGGGSSAASPPKSR